MKTSSNNNNKLALIIIIICIILLCISALCHANTNNIQQPDLVYSNRLEKINQHLQENYKLKIFNWLSLTGFFTQDYQDQMPKHTYTVLKTEF